MEKRRGIIPSRGPGRRIPRDSLRGWRHFDGRLASGVPLCAEPERLFQGPVADALTHVGQIAMLRRMAGCAMSGENYFVAAIETGRVGADRKSTRLNSSHRCISYAVF